MNQLQNGVMIPPKAKSMVAKLEGECMLLMIGDQQAVKPGC